MSRTRSEPRSPATARWTARRPANLPVRIRLHPKMQATARVKMHFAVTGEASFSAQRPQTTYFAHRDSDVIDANLAAARTLLDGRQGGGHHGGRPRQPGDPHGTCRSSLIRDFVESYQFHADSEITSDLLVEVHRRTGQVRALQTWNVAVMGRKPPSQQRRSGLDADSPLITRSKLRRPSTRSRAVIGTLMSKPDRVADLVPAAVGQAGDHRRRTPRPARRRRRGLLVLYPIDKKSEPKATGSNRVALEAVGDLLGVALCFPTADAEHRAGQHDPSRPQRRDRPSDADDTRGLRGPRRLAGRGGPRSMARQDLDGVWTVSRPLARRPASSVAPTGIRGRGRRPAGRRRQRGPTAPTDPAAPGRSRTDGHQGSRRASRAHRPWQARTTSPSSASLPSCIASSRSSAVNSPNPSKTPARRHGRRQPPSTDGAPSSPMPHDAELLSDEALIGLLGELSPCSSAARSRGARPISGSGSARSASSTTSARPPHAIEVKATLVREGRIVAISSIDQLQEPAGADLSCVHTQVRPRPRRVRIWRTSSPGSSPQAPSMTSSRRADCARSAWTWTTSRPTPAGSSGRSRRGPTTSTARPSPRLLRSSFTDGDIPPGTLRISYAIDLTNEPPSPLDDESSRRCPRRAGHGGRQMRWIPEPKPPSGGLAAEGFYKLLGPSPTRSADGPRQGDGTEQLGRTTRQRRPGRFSASRAGISTRPSATALRDEVFVEAEQGEGHRLGGRAGLTRS